MPAARACAGVRSPNRPRTRSVTTAFPRSPNSSVTARSNSLRRTSAQGELGVDGGDQIVGNDVGEGLDALQDRDAVADLAHDDRDGNVQRLGDRSEDLARRLFLTALDFTQVAQSDTRPAGDLTEGAALLLPEVTKDFADFLSYQDHDGPPPHF